MNLIFYGNNGPSWDSALGPSLLSELKPQVISVKRINNFKEIGTIGHGIIIPLMEWHMADLYRYKMPALMPSQSNIEIMQNKRKFYDYIVANKLEHLIPFTHISVQTITADKVIVKPHAQNSARGVRILSRDQITDKLCQSEIVQDLISNKLEYVSHIVCNRGKIIKCITYEYNFGTPTHIKGAVTHTRNIKKIEIDPKDIAIFEQILTPCEYTGICNVGFKYDETLEGNPIKILEINPRMGGSLMFPEHKSDLGQIIKTLISIYY